MTVFSTVILTVFSTVILTVFSTVILTVLEPRSANIYRIIYQADTEELFICATCRTCLLHPVEDYALLEFDAATQCALPLAPDTAHLTRCDGCGTRVLNKALREELVEDIILLLVLIGRRQDAVRLP